MFNNLSLPIVILSSPRTGSTALAKDILSFFTKIDPTVVWLNEIAVRVPDKPLSVDFAHWALFRGEKIYDETEFNNLLNANPFILKTHAVNAFYYYPDAFKDRLLSGDFSVVRIRRRNMLEQCISAFIAFNTRKWDTSNDHNLFLEKTTIPIDNEQIHNAISFIGRSNNVSNNFTGKISLDIVYEDYPFLTGITVKNTKISNYAEIENAVSKMMDILRIKQWKEY